ncbi:MAG: polysaccharide biosynthesis C-terminal domain-containing protein [Sulfuritalea sp.]|nr:polysaccharide biosynthesis C-terminal domain-containing protein [Sulfuritalea sp.]
MTDTASTPPAVSPPAAVTPRFVTGSLMRHVAVMASTGAVGLVAVFLVDLINLFYISLLGQQPVAAAVGFAGVVAFFQISYCIGVMIAIGAVVSRAIGAGQENEARRLATASLVLMAASCALVAATTFVFLEEILDLLGATGETRRQALGYLQITQLAMPFLGVGMGSAAILRAMGDARRAMSVTLSGAVVTAILDPVLIFGLQLDLKGAAIAAVMARMAMTGVGLYGCMRIYHLLGRFEAASFVADARRLGQVAGPSILANLATPFGAAFITHFMAQFGTAAVAGLATIDRLVPVAFGLLYALSGAVGPIIGQNFGAQRIDRVRQTLRESLRFMALAVGAAWLLLALGQQAIIFAFSATGLSAELISLFCTLLAGSFFFLGALFVANAAFNNLGYPLYSTGFNWARATLGTIPFAYVGSHYGAAGVLVGPAIGGVIFGSLAMITAFRITRRLAANGTAASARRGEAA